MVAPLKAGERMAIVGRTGSGKTYLTRWMVLRAPLQWVILDTKADSEFDHWRPVNRLLTPRNMQRLWREREIIVLRPPPGDMRPESLDRWIGDMHDGFVGFGMVIDEVYQAVGPTGMIREGLTGLLTRGRQRRQAVIMGSQRPRNVPLTMFTEADYIVAMHLNYDKDIKRVSEFTGGFNVGTLPPRYWAAFDVKAGTRSIMTPVKISA